MNLATAPLPNTTARDTRSVSPPAIKYTHGDPTHARRMPGGAVIIPNLCNTRGVWGSGHHALFHRMPSAKEAYSLWCSGKDALSVSGLKKLQGHDGQPMLMGDIRIPTMFGDFFGPYARTDSAPCLGAFQMVPVQTGIFVANIIGEDGIRRTSYDDPTIRHDAIATALARIRGAMETLAIRSPVVHSPMLGAGCAGTNWAEIEATLQREFTARHIPVVVYG